MPVNKQVKLASLIMTTFFLVSCSKTTKLLDIAKEEGVSSTTGWGIESVLKYLDVDFLLSQIEENRVHSVRHGKGVKVEVENWKSNVVFSVEPINGVGAKRTLYKRNYLRPGNYLLTANVGTGATQISIGKSLTLNFFELAKLTQANGSAGLGRLKLDVLPRDAKIVIYGTPHKYHEGLKLPEGRYEVKVSKPGYDDARVTVTITKNRLTTESIHLKPAEVLSENSSALVSAASTQDTEVEVVSITGAPLNDPKKLKQAVAQYGELVISPSRSDVRYSITSTEGTQYPMQTITRLPAGDYYVAAISTTTHSVLDQKLVSIHPNETLNTVFTLPAAAYQIPLDVVLNFKVNTLYRERVEVTLKPNQGDAITFKERMGRKGLEIETQLLNGAYHAQITGRGIKYDLGTINIAENKSNKFEFVLK